MLSAWGRPLRWTWAQLPRWARLHPGTHANATHHDVPLAAPAQRLRSSGWDLQAAASVLEAARSVGGAPALAAPQRDQPPTAAAALGRRQLSWVHRCIQESLSLADLRAVVREYGHAMDGVALAAAITRVPKVMAAGASGQPATTAPAAELVLDRLLGGLQPRLGELGSRELCNVVWALGGAGYPAQPALTQALVAALKGQGALAGASTAELAMLAKGAQALAPADDALWAAIEAGVVERGTAGELGGQAVAMLAWAVARAGRGRQQQCLLAALEQWLLATPSSTLPGLEREAKQRKGRRPHRAWQRLPLLHAAPLQLPAAAAQPLALVPASNAATLQPKELVSVLWAMATLRVAQSPALPALAAAAAARVWEFSEAELATTLAATSKLRLHCDPLLAGAASRIQRASARAASAAASTGAPARRAGKGGSPPFPPPPVSLGARGASPRLLATAALAAARLGSVGEHPTLVSAAADALAQRLPEFGAQDVTNTLVAAAAAGHGDVGWWRGVGAALTDRLRAAPHALRPQHLSGIARSFADAAAHTAAPVPGELLVALAAAAQAQAAAFNELDAAELVGAFAAAGYTRGASAVQAVVQALAASQPALGSSRSAGAIAAGLAVLGVEPPASLRQV